MDIREKNWLENRVRAAVDDDSYLDRDEEKRLKEEAATRGIPIKDAEIIVRGELQKVGAVSERQLLDQLDQLLRQFTDDDKLLDKKEERDAFDQVVIAAAGKKKGLDPRVAEEFVASFCKVNGVRRSTASRNWALPVAALVVLAVVALAVAWIVTAPRGDGASQKRGGQIAADDRAEIDRHLSRATSYIESAQYTEPPERSAKAELDAIAEIDPEGTYRGEDSRGMRHRIVQHYLELAARSRREGSLNSARQWIARARLMNVDREEISRREAELGLGASAND